MCIRDSNMGGGRQLLWNSVYNYLFLRLQYIFPCAHCFIILDGVFCFDVFKIFCYYSRYGFYNIPFFEIRNPGYLRAS